MPLFLADVQMKYLHFLYEKMSQKSIYGVNSAKIPIISFLKVDFQSKKAQKV